MEQSMKLEFTVYGEPIPQGSMKAFIPKGWTRAVLTSDNKRTKPWRQAVAGSALEVMDKENLECAGKNVPFLLAVVFRFTKPRSVRKSILEKTTKPDIDKLVRSILDALTGILFVDDSQVVAIYARKEFGAQPMAKISAWEIEEFPVGKPVVPEWVEIPF